MIQGFELETAPLNKYEKETLLPRMIEGLSRCIGEENRRTNSKIQARLKFEGYSVNSARIRKLINHIRIHGLVERLAASSKGYWVEYDDTKLENYIQSRKERVKAENAATAALERQLMKAKQMSLI